MEVDGSPKPGLLALPVGSDEGKKSWARSEGKLVERNLPILPEDGIASDVLEMPSSLPSSYLH